MIETYFSSINIKIFNIICILPKFITHKKGQLQGQSNIIKLNFLQKTIGTSRYFYITITESLIPTEK